MKLIHNFIFVILTTSIILLLTEITLRIVDPLDRQDKAKIYMKINYPNDYNYKNLEKKPKVFSHPYLNYSNTPFFKNSSGVFQHDQNGFRENENTKNNHIKKIVVLGGSIAYGSGVDKPEDTWANILQKKLNSENYEFDVVNAGLEFATSAELLTLYSLKLTHFNHKILLIHLGANENLPIIFPNFDKTYIHVRGQSGNIAGELEKKLLKNSYIFKILISKITRENYFGTYKGRPYSYLLLDKDKVTARTKNLDLYQPFKNNLRNIIRIAKSYGVKVVIIPADINKKFYRKDLDYIKEGLSYYHENIRQIIKEISLGENVYLHENDIDENFFVDNVHVNLDGQKQKAFQIFSFLKENLLN